MPALFCCAWKSGATHGAKHEKQNTPSSYLDGWVEKDRSHAQKKANLNDGVSQESRNISRNHEEKPKTIQDLLLPNLAENDKQLLDFTYQMS